MGMVMLHRHQRQSRFSRNTRGIFAGQVFRVQVAGNDFRLDAEKPFIELDGMFKMLQRFFIFHIADMLTDESVVVAGQAEGIFQFRAAGQDLFRLEGEVDGIRGIAAGAP